MKNILRVLSALMLLTAADLPPYGSDTAPTVNEVAQRYVEQGTQETGAVNTVAGMILAGQVVRELAGLAG